MSRLNPWNLFFKSFCDHIEIVCIIITAISCIKMRKKKFELFSNEIYLRSKKPVLTIKSFFSIFTVIYRYSYDPGWFGTWFRFCCHGQYSLFLNWATFPGKKESLREIKLIRDKKEDEQFFVYFSRSQQLNELSITATSWIKSENLHTLIFLTNI